LATKLPLSPDGRCFHFRILAGRASHEQDYIGFFVLHLFARKRRKEGHPAFNQIELFISAKSKDFRIPKDKQPKHKKLVNFEQEYVPRVVESFQRRLG
jgi:hypothetical protein